MTATALPETVEELQQRLHAQGYLADRGLTTSILLALRLGRPLLLEGDAGVGKTEVAKVLAALLGTRLIRLQCYEGIDARQALFEWDYPRQLLHLRALEATKGDAAAAENELYSERFLLERPLLSAIRAGSQAVLLIDEIDRSDAEFEAFLLEILSEFQISVPEFGTIRASHPPIVILTSNRTRELHSALKRRCLYHWIDHPSPEREAAIVRIQATEASAVLAQRVAGVIARLRALNLYKPPGVAESIDWTRVLTMMGTDTIDQAVLEETLGTLIKDHDDLVRVRESLQDILDA